MSDGRACLLYATFPDAEMAQRIGRLLVEEHLAACCNLLGPIHSIYWWEGAVQEAPEAAMVVKTTPGMAAAATARIVGMHPYENPAVLQLAVTGGAADFLNWIAMSVLPPEAAR